MEVHASTMNTLQVPSAAAWAVSSWAESMKGKGKSTVSHQEGARTRSPSSIFISAPETTPTQEFRQASLPTSGKRVSMETQPTTPSDIATPPGKGVTYTSLTTKVVTPTRSHTHPEDVRTSTKSAITSVSEINLPGQIPRSHTH